MIHSFLTLSDAGDEFSFSERKALLCVDDRRELWIYLLTPGFTLGYHQRVLKVSDITLRRHRNDAEVAQCADPTIARSVYENVSSITPEDGLAMAQRRGTAHLPYWSRLAMCEYRGRLPTAREVARLFRCSPTTVSNATTSTGGSFDIFSAARRLSPQQVHPAGQWRPRSSMHPSS